jgi:hypothetical protein
MRTCVGGFFLKIADRPELPVLTAAASHDWPYMDAPTLPSFQFMSACRLRLHPYIRTFAAAFAAVPDGIG